jgi:hypothetical protein
MEGVIMFKKSLILLAILLIAGSVSGCAQKSTGISEKSQVKKSVAAATTATFNIASVTGVNKEILTTTQAYLDAVKNTDYNGLTNIMSANGIVLIAHYTENNQVLASRKFYAKADIPKNLTFPLSAATNIAIKDRFKTSFQTIFNTERIIVNTYPAIVLTDSATNDAPYPSEKSVMNQVYFIIQKSNLYYPVIYTIGDSQFILSEAENDNGYPNGTVAVFTKENNAYKLTAILSY